MVGHAKDGVPRRVLIIDDEARLLAALAEHFTDIGYDVHTAGETEEAEALLANYRYSLIITDLALSAVGLRGFDILDQTWDLCDRPKVIVLTGHGEAEVQVEATRKGVDAFVQKPVRLQRLSQVAAHVLGDMV